MLLKSRNAHTEKITVRHYADSWISKFYVGHFEYYNKIMVAICILCFEVEKEKKNERKTIRG
jgi:hypothetical protein